MNSVKIRDLVVEAKSKITIDRIFSEQHDTGQLTIVSTFNKRFEMYSPVDIEINGVTEQMLVESDNAIQHNATEYEHQITLVENKAKFDTFYPADRPFTVVGQTVEDILNVYKRELSHYHNLDIDWSLTSAQLNTVYPFETFSGVNFTSIITTLFRRINAIPYVVRQGNLWVIHALEYTKRNNLVTIGHASNRYQQNNIDYATKVKSQIKNAINERITEGLVYFPSETGYMLPKSDKAVTLSSDLKYIIPSRIARITESISPNVQWFNNNLNETRILDLNITDHVVPKEIYDSLPNLSTNSNAHLSLNKRNAVKYDIGGNNIYDLYESSSSGIFGFFKEEVEYLINALKRQFYLSLVALGEEAEYNNWVLQSGIPNTAIETRLVKLRIKYIKERDMDIIHHRHTKGDMIESTTMHQQRKSEVEVSQFKKLLKNYANRMGNDKFTKTKFVEYGEQLELSDFTNDNKVVVRVRNTYHPTGVFCEWEETTNFANIEAVYSISNVKEPYTITGQKIHTNLISEEYAIFSERDYGVLSRLNTNGVRAVFGILENITFATINPIKHAIFKPDKIGWVSANGIHMEIDANSDGNLLTVHTFFNNPLSAGFIFFDVDTQTVTDEVQPLKYTEDDGTLTDFSIYYSSEVTIEDGGEYPLIVDDTNFSNNAYSSPNVEPLDLDINASFAHTYNLSFLGEENVIVGEALTRRNFLIKEQPLTINVEVYKSTKPFSIYDQTVRSGDTLANMSWSFNNATRKLSFTANETIEYFALVEDGDILLAFNKLLAQTESYEIYASIVNNLTDLKFYAANIDATLQNITATVTYEFFKLYQTSINAFLGNISATVVADYALRILDASVNALLQGITATVTPSYSNRIWHQQVSATLQNISATVNYNYVVDTSINAVFQDVSANVVADYSNRIWDRTSNATLQGITATVNAIYSSKDWTRSVVATLQGISATIIASYVDRLWLPTINATLQNITATVTYTYLQPTFDYLGTTTQPHDVSLVYAIEGDNNTPCPTALAVETWLNNNYNAEDYNIGDIVRVQTLVVDNQGFPVKSCDTHYFEVILA
jgi:hypothetical protein